MKTYIIVAAFSLATSSCGKSTESQESKQTAKLAEQETRFPKAAAALAELTTGLDSLRSEYDSRNEPPTIADELAHMVQVDAFARGFMMPAQDTYKGEEATYYYGTVNPLVGRIDRANTSRMKELVDEHGWITISEFGEEADTNAWTLVQHADEDRAFQKRVLSLLERHVTNGETSPSNYGYLHDRLAKAENRLQRYGTQGNCVEGRYTTDPLEDEANIEAIRASVGMISFEMYKELSEFNCK